MDVYAARYVLPVATPVLADGAVAVADGRVAAVGARADVLRAVGPAAAVFDLGDAAILPGLVNAHTHIELAWTAGAELPRGSFVAWVRALVELREGGEPPHAAADAERTVRAMIERGTVAVGDVSNGASSAPLVARSPLHGVVFHEIYDADPERAEERLRAGAERLEYWALDPDVAGAQSRLQIALTPHAPYSTSAPLLRALAGRAVATGEPLTVHVAESAEEAALFHDGGGGLRELLAARGMWNPAWHTPGRTPIEHLKRLGVLSPRTLAVHCVHLTQQDRSTLQATGATVVTCPRSNAALGVGRAPILALLREGVPVALGTDSLASVPDLDLFAELAALRATHPGLPPAAALRMATLNGARALGLGDRLGSIEIGKLAELIVVPLDDDTDAPLELVGSAPERVYRLRDAARELAGAAP